MALILDLAVLAIAAVVVGSLALLTWTFAASSVHSVGRGRTQVGAARSAVAEAEARIQDAGRRSRQVNGDNMVGTRADEEGEHTDG